MKEMIIGILIAVLVMLFALALFLCFMIGRVIYLFWVAHRRGWKNISLAGIALRLDMERAIRDGAKDKIDKYGLKGKQT